MQVPSYEPRTAADIAACEAAQARQTTRKLNAAKSLSESIPSLEEQQILHDMHRRGIDNNTEVDL